jgi:hypothetical protein
MIKYFEGNNSLRSKKIIGAIVVITLILLIITMWNIPRISIAKTMNSIKIIGPVYRGEAGAFDQFYLNYRFKNPERATVEIIKLEPEIILNGTNYNSIQTTHGLTTIPPDSESELVRVVQLANAPISNIEGQHCNITVVTEITGKSSYLIFKETKTITIVTSIDWEVHLFE